MKWSNKGEAPQILLRWIREQREILGENPTFETFQRPEKDHLRHVLLIEQGFLCAYCGRALAADFSDSHMDHFWPQSVFNGQEGREDLRLAQANLFQSCGPSSLPSSAARALPFTCGSAKGEWYDEEHSIIPSQADCEGRFMYDGAGQIRAADDQDTGAINMIGKLRLYDQALNSERKKIAVELEREFLDLSPSAAEVRREIDRWLHADDAGRLSGFAQVAKRYLEEESRE